MFSTVLSAGIYGIDSREVHVEVDVSDGLPMFIMVGYLSSQVKEAQERVRTALKNSGIRLPPKKVTVNLSPSDLKKMGSGFDLPIAAAILVSYGFITQEAVTNILFAGELSLNGKINGIQGILSIVSEAKRLGCTACIIPEENQLEGSVIKGINVWGAGSLIEMIDFLNGRENLRPLQLNLDHLFDHTYPKNPEDFRDLNGQECGKRAAEIAVSGMHNFLMAGPPGSGKSMLARRIPTILPPLTLEESLESSKVYSVAGMLPKDVPLLKQRPFRAPHHTITLQSLAGGGITPKPGEISLAHNGILFLDEIAEFRRDTLEILRQPMEEQQISISRTGGRYIFPANFMLVGAMNPCRCGYYPDLDKCICTEHEIRQYLSRLSGPLLDRFDISVEVAALDYQGLSSRKENEASEIIQKRVMCAHQIQKNRYEGTPFRFNSDLNTKGIQQYCKLGEQEEKLLEHAFEKLGLSARAYHRIIKVARTIADMDGAEMIHTSHISEAICYRTAIKFWNE